MFDNSFVISLIGFLVVLTPLVFMEDMADLIDSSTNIIQN